jgi:hypothetical protein
MPTCCITHREAVVQPRGLHLQDVGLRRRWHQGPLLCGHGWTNWHLVVSRRLQIHVASRPLSGRGADPPHSHSSARPLTSSDAKTTSRKFRSRLAWEVLQSRASHAPSVVPVQPDRGLPAKPVQSAADRGALRHRSHRGRGDCEPRRPPGAWQPRLSGWRGRRLEHSLYLRLWFLLHRLDESSPSEQGGDRSTPRMVQT